jgi:spore coat polysaccharide biosynthesis protein SpsF
LQARKKKISAIIQARMTSTRLPGKVLQDICGQPLLWWIIQRLQECKTLDAIAVATTIDPSDDLISQYCEKIDVPCFRGSMDDVLARLLFAAEQLDATHIVRITGDVPFVDAELIDRAVSAMIANDADLVRCSRPVVHEGIDPCSVSLLKRIGAATDAQKYREHVLAYAWDHPGFAKNTTIDPDTFEAREGYHFSVDNLADLEFARRVYSHFLTADSPQKYFSMKEVLAFLDAHPEVRAINQKVKSNQARVPVGAPTPRVAILLDGGQQTGFGHLIRMKQLAKELNSYFNCAVYFIAPDNPVCHQHLDAFGLPAMFLPDHDGSIDPLECSDRVAVASTKSMHSNFSVKLSSNLKIHSLTDTFEFRQKPIDVIIVDRQNGISANEARQLKSCAAKLVVIDFASEELSRVADLIFLPNLHASDEILQSSWWKRQPHKCLAGSEYVILREAFWSAKLQLCREERETEVSHSYCLLSVGGTDPHGLLKPLVEHLLNLWPGEIVVLAGAISENRLKPYAGNSRIRMTRSISDFEMVKLMDESALAITVFGTVCYELLSRAVPMIILPHGEKDRAAAMNFCERSRSAVYIDSPDLLDETSLESMQRLRVEPITKESRTAKTIFDLLNSKTH